MGGSTTEFMQRPLAATGADSGSEHTKNAPQGVGADTSFVRNPDLVLFEARAARLDIEAHLKEAGKSNYCSLPDPERAEILRKVTERYDSMPSMLAARELFESTIDKLAADPAIAGVVQQFARAAEGYYVNTDQYHNAEHALVMSTYHIALLAADRQLADGHQLLRAALRGIFHDCGNARNPEVRRELKGQDEVEAALTLLRETNRATYSNSVNSDAAVLLFNGAGENRFPAAERLHDAACVLSTVFADRFCSRPALEKQAYVSRFCAEVRANAGTWKIDDHAVQELAATLGLKGDFSLRAGLEQVVASAMLTKEAYALRHADLCSSLGIVNGCRDGILNRKEDENKPWVTNEEDPVNYNQGFRGFVTGGKHALAHPGDVSAPAYLAALQLEYDKVIPPELKQAPDAAARDRLREALTSCALPADTAGALADFTAAHGWQPTIFYGVSEKVARFGVEKLAGLDAFRRELEGPDRAMMHLLHVVIKEDPGFDLAAAALGEIVERIGRAAASRNVGLDWSRYGELTSGSWSKFNFASLTGKKITQLFMPALGARLDPQEIKEEIGALLA